MNLTTTSGVRGTDATTSSINSLVAAPTITFAPPAGLSRRLTAAQRGSRQRWALMAGTNCGGGVADTNVVVMDMDRTDAYTQGIAKHDFPTRSGPTCSPPV